MLVHYRSHVELQDLQQSVLQGVSNIKLSQDRRIFSPRPDVTKEVTSDNPTLPLRRWAGQAEQLRGPDLGGDPCAGSRLGSLAYRDQGNPWKIPEEPGARDQLVFAMFPSQIEQRKSST